MLYLVSKLLPAKNHQEIHNAVGFSMHIKAPIGFEPEIFQFLCNSLFHFILTLVDGSIITINYVTECNNFNFNFEHSMSLFAVFENKN